MRLFTIRINLGIQMSLMATVREHCCGADVFFDQKMAEKQYRQYLKKGATGVTAKMIEQLQLTSPEGKSLIDIGGGIGALQWWFLEKGGAKSISVDASSGYIELAEKHAEAHDLTDRTQFVFGDFAEIHGGLERADYITLDKVVCCYPNYEEILEASCDKAGNYLSLSYPMDGWLAQLVALLGVVKARMKTSSFRPYVHPVSKMRDIITQQGFERMAYKMVFPWHVETYKRSEPSDHK